MYHILNLILMYVIVRALVYNPVRKFMNQRAERVAAEQQAAQTALKEAEAEKAKYQQHLEQAKEEAAKIRKESEEHAQASVDLMMEDAKKRSDALLQSAREQIEIERQTSMEQMRDEFAGLAVQIASKVLEREVNEKDNAAVIDEFFKHVG